MIGLIAAYIAAGLTFVAIMLAIDRQALDIALMAPEARDIRFRVGFTFAIVMVALVWPLALLFICVSNLLESRR